VTDRELDLSGFQTERKVDVAPPKKKKKAGKKAGSKKKDTSAGKVEKAAPEALEAAPSVETPKPRRKSKTVAKPHRKKRVNVSLPVGLSRRFTEKADEEDRYLTDLVLEAYRNHYGNLLNEVEDEQGDSDLPLRPRRRKAATGRVTHMLYLAAPEIAVIDGSAEEIGLSRSELVAQLLMRELG